MKKCIFLLLFSTYVLLCSCCKPVPTFDPVLQSRCQNICDMCVDLGIQTGMQFCVYQEGECIVDVCSGRLSREENAPKVTPSSLFAIFSTEKPLLSTAVHRAVEMGLMDYDKPLNTWWPEFTGDGKDSLTLGMTLAYRSGMPGSLDQTLFPTWESRTDWRKILEWAAAVKPVDKPCTVQKYMPLSYAWMLGHPLEVAYGKPLKETLDELVLEPSGISDEFFFAAGDKELPRIATIYGEPVEHMNLDTLRKTCMPSAWAVASARSIAKFYNRLCGYDGMAPLISKETLDKALVLCRAEDDPLPSDLETNHHMIFGMGYGLWGHTDNLSKVFGHAGAGGSATGLVDRERHITIGITCNESEGSCLARYLLLKAINFEWRNSDNPVAPL